MATLLQQYLTIKEKYPDAVLLFRVGDFYETFNEDAKILARHTEVIVVASAEDGNIKTSASLFHHFLHKALHQLVKAGHRVAICEELEERKASPMMRA